MSERIELPYDLSVALRSDDPDLEPHVLAYAYRARDADHPIHARLLIDPPARWYAQKFLIPGRSIHMSHGQALDPPDLIATWMVITTAPAGIERGPTTVSEHHAVVTSESGSHFLRLRNARFISQIDRNSLLEAAGREAPRRVLSHYQMHGEIPDYFVLQRREDGDLGTGADCTELRRFLRAAPEAWFDKLRADVQRLMNREGDLGSYLAAKGFAINPDEFVQLRNTLNQMRIDNNLPSPERLADMTGSKVLGRCVREMRHMWASTFPIIKPSLLFRVLADDYIRSDDYVTVWTMGRDHGCAVASTLAGEAQVVDDLFRQTMSLRQWREWPIALAPVDCGNELPVSRLPNAFSRVLKLAWINGQNGSIDRLPSDVAVLHHALRDDAWPTGLPMPDVLKDSVEKALRCDNTWITDDSFRKGKGAYHNWAQRTHEWLSYAPAPSRRPSAGAAEAVADYIREIKQCFVDSAVTGLSVKMDGSVGTSPLPPPVPSLSGYEDFVL